MMVTLLMRGIIFIQICQRVRGSTTHMRLLWFFGDFNTQLGYAGCDESNFLGPYMYQKLFHEENNVLTNRCLFAEYCGTHAFVVGNTLFDYADDYLVTYHNLVSHPMDIKILTT